MRVILALTVLAYLLLCALIIGAELSGIDIQLR